MGIFSPYYTNNNNGNNQDTTTDTKSILDPLTDSSNKCCLTCESCDNPPFLEENGKIINQNCKTCIKGYNLLFATKDCYNSSILKEGYYLSSKDSMYHKCDIQCKTCEYDSVLNKPICISCNYNKGFYTAEKKSTSNCYNRTTIDTNYYLNKDITNNKWALCYTSCGSCDSAGNNSIHNCKSCKKNYYPLFDNKSNCFNNETIYDGFYLKKIDNKYYWKKCYERCKACTSEGNSTNMNCLSCKDNLMKKLTSKLYLKLDENGNCIEYCPDNLYLTSIGDCVDICPSNTYIFSNNHTCLDTCPQNYEIDEDNKKCIVKVFDISTPKNEFKNKILNNITEFVSSSNIVNGSDFIASISYSDNVNPEEQIKNGKSAIDLGNCTQTIKKHYNISDDEKLIIVNMEQKYNKTRENKNDENSSVDLGKNMQIEVYDISGKKLDLSVCKEEIKVMKYIGDVEELNIDLTKELSNQGIDAFNRNDKFFNDICHSLKNRSQDIILKDRIADIYQNVDLCQKGCVYNGMNYTLKIANCICDSSLLQIAFDNKTNLDNKNDVEKKVDLKGIKSIIKYSLEQINFNVISCSNLVFDEKILMNNIGFFCMIIMFILQLIFLFIYIIKKLKSLRYFMLIFSSKNHKSKGYANLPKNNINGKRYLYQLKNIKGDKTEMKLENKVINNINNFRSKILFFDDKNKRINIENNNNNKKNVIIEHYEEPSNFILSEENNNVEKSNKKILTNNFNASSNNSILYVNEKKTSKSKFNNQIKLNKNKINTVNADKMYIKNKKINKFKKSKFQIQNRAFIETNGKMNKSNINNDLIYLSKSDDNLQELGYESSLIYDKRSFMKMYFSFLKESQIILSTFCSKNYLDLFIIKLSFLTFNFQISFFLNALFYTEDYISEAYHNDGVLNFISSLPKSIYSFMVAMIITNLLRMLSNSKSELMRIIIRQRKTRNYINLINIKLLKLRKKLIVYFTLIILLGIFFLYYVTAFCAVYYNSQIYWLIGCVESFALDSLTALIICVFITFFRYLSIKKRIKYFYSLSNIINSLL